MKEFTSLVLPYGLTLAKHKSMGFIKVLIILSIAALNFACTTEEPVSSYDSLSSSSSLKMQADALTISPGGTTALQVSGGNPPYSKYTVVSGGGSISENRGVYYYVAPTNIVGTAVNVSLSVRDSVGDVAYASIQVSTFAASALTVSAAATTLQARGNTTLSVTGGSAPYTWSASSGDLSSMSGNSVTYTAPNSAGSVSISVTDGAGKSGSLSLTISAAAEKVYVVYPGCGGQFCSCVTPGQPGVPYIPAAQALCQARGHSQVVQFSTVNGPVGYYQCDANGQNCFVNQSVSNIVCYEIKCQ